MMESKNGRQKLLKEEFSFICDCIACSNEHDFPLVNSMPIKNNNLLNLIKQINHLYTKSEVLKVIDECAKNLNKYSTLYPSRELCLIQKIYVLALLKLAAPKMVSH